MKISVYNLEPKYTNIALEKIRLFYLLNGEEVEDYFPLSIDTYDKIYCSSIFNFTEKINPPQAICGGTGFDLVTNLPKEIDDMKPKLGIGFTVKGCVRNCPFVLSLEKRD